ncbi:hypothetical protein AAL_05231 [Moelleriella libera RCEF 2490]|uniref:NAD(P)-binding domain protein n=1 Tax=Moelleriella libera RCEF 2490 TaxID=1081109 RepID=A0A168ARX6_9HYPO|nr:hypothetical protein AAL_05231 [Moelleriella libera RCEF 2490]
MNPKARGNKSPLVESSEARQTYTVRTILKSDHRGQSVFTTGASGRIGRATVIAFAEAGAAHIRHRGDFQPGRPGKGDLVGGCLGGGGLHDDAAAAAAAATANPQARSRCYFRKGR